MNSFPGPQHGKDPVGFVYFQNSPCQASTSGASETLDYIEFSNTPNTPTDFQPGCSSSPQQFRQKNSRYHRGNRNKNYRQFHSNIKYQGNKQFSPNPNQSYSPGGNYSPRGNFNPRGNYTPRGNFTPRGRGNFTPRGNFNSRGNFRNQNKYKKKPYDKSDIRWYVNRSMVENPWEKLMSKINLKPSGSSNPRTSTITSGDSKDECMTSDSNLSESTQQKRTCTVTSGDSNDECMTSDSNQSESTQPKRTCTVTSDDSKDERMISDPNQSESTQQLNVEPKSTNSEDLTDEKLSALSDADKNVNNSTESVAEPETKSTTVDVSE